MHTKYTSFTFMRSKKIMENYFKVVWTVWLVSCNTVHGVYSFKIASAQQAKTLSTKFKLWRNNASVCFKRQYTKVGLLYSWFRVENWLTFFVIVSVSSCYLYKTICFEKTVCNFFTVGILILNSKLWSDFLCVGFLFLSWFFWFLLIWF
jgi:hypothetical protein